MIEDIVAEAKAEIAEELCLMALAFLALLGV